jgi:hypothetical protein
MNKPEDSSGVVDHAELRALLVDLVARGRHQNALYLIGILKTDLAELGLGTDDPTWPRPGEGPPLKWQVYGAALRWCREGFGA